jgi:hypothetical protein
MHKQTTVNSAGPSLMYSERWEIDHLCNCFGLSRAAARNIVRNHFGDRTRMEQESRHLAKFERLHWP